MDFPLLTFQARTATPTFSVGGVDLLAGLDVTQILTFSYVDSTSDKADSLAIELADPNRTWMMRFQSKIKKGIQCTASIIIADWTLPADNRVLDCGIFYISNVSFKGGSKHGNLVTIKATSIPPNGVKHTKKFKSWEKTDLKSIAGNIATSNNLTLFYDASENPKVKRTDQSGVPDLQYLRDRCKEAKLSLKIHRNQLVIYDEEEYESKPAAITINYGASEIIEFDFNSKIDDLYASCTNSYTNPETGKTTKTKFVPDTPPEGPGAELIENESIEYEPSDPDPETSPEDK